MDKVDVTDNPDKRLKGLTFTGRDITETILKMKPMKHEIGLGKYFKKFKLWLRKKSYRISVKVNKRDGLGVDVRVIFNMVPNWIGKVFKYPEYRQAYLRKGSFGEGWTRICGGKNTYYVPSKMKLYLNDVCDRDRKRKNVGL